jgi:hypothetical protein
LRTSRHWDRLTHSVSYSVTADIYDIANSILVLGAISKSLATLATQPLIVAKVGLQSKPPSKRNGKPFKGFVEVMAFIVEHEGLMSLFKGIGPQLMKGLLVQGLLMMTKERYVFYTLAVPDGSTDIVVRIELAFILFFRYLRQLRQQQLQKLAAAVGNAASKAGPVLAK